ncbi:thiol-disulfide oxidoreductase DCC family protein [Alkalihalobacterium bogoriense]|uniref:thiol-disulfide oxidoreductase DCC family protein n=1 Tax=Alkalihalobacterium bogoriense TaxID=246272 RepID=UPI00047CDEEC|nr:thiol-disulfide oxidoreductase DCC family protein [Alkalihalobacterium bogoriense]
MNQRIVLFDGVCNLCHSLVTFIIKRDKNAKLSFASIQSEKGQQLLQYHGLPTNDLKSFVYIEGDKCYTKSTAALHVCKRLDKLYPLLFIFIVIPKPLRDLVYRYVADNRYKWFGEKQECMLPTQNLKKRFLT